jgi:hypothetical protein
MKSLYLYGHNNHHPNNRDYASLGTRTYLNDKKYLWKTKSMVTINGATSFYGWRELIDTQVVAAIPSQTWCRLWLLTWNPNQLCFILRTRVPEDVGSAFGHWSWHLPNYMLCLNYAWAEIRRNHKRFGRNNIK